MGEQVLSDMFSKLYIIGTIAFGYILTLETSLTSKFDLKLNVCLILTKYFTNRVLSLHFLPLFRCTLILMENKQNKQRSFPSLLFQP